MPPHPAREHDADRGHREGEQHERAEEAEHLADAERARRPAARARSAPCPARPRRPPPPAALPSTSTPRDTGATSISRMNPNSRSHTIAIAENSDDVITDIAMTPGKDVLLVRRRRDAAVSDEVREPGAEHEQEQQRLRQAGDDRVRACAAAGSARAAATIPTARSVARPTGRSRASARDRGRGLDRHRR